MMNHVRVIENIPRRSRCFLGTLSVKNGKVSQALTYLIVCGKVTVESYDFLFEENRFTVGRQEAVLEPMHSHVVCDLSYRQHVTSVLLGN